jgi:imidazolonepropionase-like amidohydrolase
MKQKIIFPALALVFATALFSGLTFAAEDEALPQVLIKDVHVWDGTSDGVTKKINVLVEGSLIKKIRASESDANAGATIIDGNGSVMIPGLIDMHSHLCIQEGMLVGRDNYDQMAMGARTAISMQQYLEQGFTTARDLGCNVLGVAKAVNNGLIPGPRIYPAGGFLSQTGGHADTGSFNDVPGRVDDLERHGFGYIVDGKTEAI